MVNGVAHQALHVYQEHMGVDWKYVSPLEMDGCGLDMTNFLRVGEKGTWRKISQE